MSKYDIAQRPACWKRTKYNICIKLSIAIMVCALLCGACYFVEKGRTTRELYKYQSSEKLIQVSKPPSSKIQPRNIQKPHPNAIALSNIEGSGDFVAASTPIQLTAVETSETSSKSYFDDLPSHELTAEPPYGNKIQKVLEQIPLLQDDTVDAPASTEIIENTSYLPPPSLPSYDYPEEQIINDALEQLALENHKTIATSIKSNERLFSNEYPFDLGPSSYDDSSDEYIFTNYDNGDYMHVKEVPASSHEFYADDLDDDDDEEEEEIALTHHIPVVHSANAPTIFDSLFGSVSNLLNAKPPVQKRLVKPQRPPVSPPLPPQAASSHLANFKDTPYPSDHLQQGSYVKPIVNEPVMKEPPVIEEKPKRKSLRQRKQQRPMLLKRLLDRRRNPVESSLKILQNLLN